MHPKQHVSSVRLEEHRDRKIFAHLIFYHPDFTLKEILSRQVSTFILIVDLELKRRLWESASDSGPDS